MTISAAAPDERIKGVTFDAANLHVELTDGHRISAPLLWFPRLAAATAEQLAQWRTIGAGDGIHWTLLDEDISVEGLLRGTPAPGYLPAATATPT